jgi:hypothetical protein
MHAKAVTFLILVLRYSAALQPGKADVLSTEDTFFFDQVITERSLMRIAKASESEGGTEGIEATEIQGGAEYVTNTMLVTTQSEGVRRKDRALLEILSNIASSKTVPAPQRLRGVTVKH